MTSTFESLIRDSDLGESWNPLGPTHSFINRVRQLMNECEDELPSKQTTLEVVALAYDEFIGPINSAIIPDLIGGPFDTLMREVVIRAVERIYDQLAE